MGTTSEKLTYLNNTKQLLKDKINNLGGSITSETTFREYTDELQGVYDNAPKTSFQTGTEVTLENCLKGKLDFEEDNGKKVVGIGQSSQDSTQGYNLFVDIATQTLNGMTITRTDNGYVLNGTSTAVTTFRGTIPNPINSNKTLVAKCDTDIANANIQVKTRSATQVQLRSISLSTKETWVVSSGEYEDVLCDIVVKSGVTLNNVLVQPMLLNGTYTTSNVPNYEKYTGGQASPNPSYPQTINSVTGNQDVVVSGKNEFNLNDTHYYRFNDVTISNNTISVTNISTTAGNWVWWNIPVKTGKNITVSYGDIVEASPNSNNRVQFYFSETAVTSYSSNFQNGFNVDKTTKTITETATNNYLVLLLRTGNGNSYDISNIQVEYSNEKTTYEPYITPITKTLSLGDIELNAIGNYKDELIYDVDEDRVYKNEKIGKVVLNGSEENWNKNSTRYSYNISGYENGALQIYSNYFKGITSWVSHSSTPDTCILDKESSWDNARISFNASGIASVTDGASWKAWLSTHNTEVCYPLATPVEKPITDTTLINQVKALYNAHSNNGTTIIEGNGDLPMVIKVRALKGE